MKKTYYVCGLDIGASKLCASMGRVNFFQPCEILSCVSLKRPDIRQEKNADLAALAAEIIRQAEENTGQKADFIFSNISADTLRLVPKQINLYLKKKLAREKIIQILTEEIDADKKNRVLQILPQSFISGAREITNLSQAGSGELQTNFLLLQLAEEDWQGYLSLLGRLRKNITGVCLSAWASSLAILSQAEKAAPLLVMDWGKQWTEALALNCGKVSAYEYFHFGAGDFTQAIAHKFNLDLALAEEIKQNYGVVDIDSLAHDKLEQELVFLADAKMQRYPKRELAQLLEKEARDRLSYIREKLSAVLSAEKEWQVVICGQGALLEGFLELAEKIFSRPVRLGTVDADIESKWRSPAYVTSIGLIVYAREYLRQPALYHFKRKGIFYRWQSLLKKVIQDYF